MLKTFRYLFIPLRLLLIVFTLSVYICLGGAVALMLAPFSFLRRRVATSLNIFTCKIILKLLFFDVVTKGPKPQEGSLIIGNHMSYLDILIYLSQFKTIFVTSVDMKYRPFLGQITMIGGCLYVERRNPRNLPNELKTLKKYFDAGFTVCVFPEGTSSDGKTVLPFKKSLFQIALETKAHVQPIVLKYKKVNGEPFGDKNRDSVCWYGEMGFFSHFLKLMTLKSVEAEFSVLNTIASTQFASRKDLAEHTHSRILQEYQY